MTAQHIDQRPMPRPLPQHPDDATEQPLVLVGYDDSDVSTTESIVIYAARLAGRLGGRLHVVLAVPAPRPESLAPPGALLAPYPSSELSWSDEDQRRQRDEQRHELANRLRVLLAPEAVPWTCVVRPGEAADVLADSAADGAAHLVVVGASSRGFGATLDRLLNGSTVRTLEQRLETDAHDPSWSLVIVPHA